MTEHAFPVGPNKAPLRLQFTASEELQETLSLLIRPELQRKFGQKTLHVVVRNVLLGLSGNREQFIAQQERIVAEYTRGIHTLATRQFSLQPIVRFALDAAQNLHVGVELVTSQDEREKIMAPPFYDTSSSTAAVGARVVLPRRDILPSGALLRNAAHHVESAFGERHPGMQAAGKASSRLYVYDLGVSRPPFRVKPNEQQRDEGTEVEAQ